MISATTGKEVDSTKKWNIITEHAHGFVEALNLVDGVYRSFNVYRGKPIEKNTLFYKSSYRLETAMKHLNEL